MRPDKLRTLLAMAAGVALYVWFLFLIRGGLDSGFGADDLMNLHYYWWRPWSQLLEATLAFWSSYYRPGGGLFYRSIYVLCGFHPLPFRIAALALLSIDFGLLALVVRQLTGSRWCALLALLLVGINPTFSALYFDTGPIYDVLAYSFFWGAFVLYVHIRRSGRIPGLGGLALLLCLLVLALDSKEISVLLPVAVGLYELIWHPPTGRTFSARYAAIGALFDVAYIAGKRYGAESLWNLEASYRPHFSFTAYFESLAHYFRELIYHNVTISSWQIAGLLAVMVTVAAITRRQSLLWGAGFILAGVLPLAFISGRGGFAYLVPSVGWAVYVTGLLGWILEKLAGRRPAVRTAVQVLSLALLFVIAAPWQHKWIEMHAGATHKMRARFQQDQEQIQALIPAPRKGARILLLSDAHGSDDYDEVFLIRLIYGDPSLEANRMKILQQSHTPPDPASYDYVLDWRDGRFVLVGRPRG
jgi:hypothetical protein